jgi:hypothetical protein
MSGEAIAGLTVSVAPEKLFCTELALSSSSGPGAKLSELVSSCRLRSGDLDGDAGFGSDVMA